MQRGSGDRVHPSGWRKAAWRCSARVVGVLRDAAAVIAAGIALFYAQSAIAEPGVTAQSVLIGQSVSLTGPLGAIGTDYSEGFKVGLEDVNRRGGVHGRSIKLIQMDDGYAAPRALANTVKMLDEDGVFMLVGSLGTAPVGAVLPLIAERRVPLFAAFTGADSLRREHNRYLFTVMASYGVEAEKMVQHLTTIGHKSIAVAYQNNAFGEDGLAGAEAALKKRQMTPVVAASIETDARDAIAAAQTIARAKPQAVLVMMAGKATIEFTREFRKLDTAAQVLMLSVADTNQLLRELGKQAAGIVVAQTMPAPFLEKSPLSKEFRTLMKAAGKADHIGYAAMTGFVAAKAFAKALLLAGPEPTRERFIVAVQNSRSMDLNGFHLSFAAGQHHAGRYVELTMIRPGKSLFVY